MTSSHTERKPLHPFCNVCGWRKGGLDSWDGRRCKCGHYEPPFPQSSDVTPIGPAPSGLTVEEANAIQREVEIAKSCAHGTDPDALSDEQHLGESK